ncbi:S49 family peptidase, partial [Enterobacter hormaechei]|uniref:S49 family peptidase n=1 Tax=Enterobacter hormaechei TaxID=158836 RepID=UPI0023E36D6A
YGAALKTNGVEVTLIYSGDHKVDGNPYEKLPEDVRADFQTRIDATRQMFAEKVSAYTGMSVQDVLDTEAAVFSGQESVDNGLADELVNNTDALGVMREALDRRKKTTIGGTMPSPSASAATNNPADQASTQTTTSAEQLTDADTTTAAIAAPADVSAQVYATRTAK